MKKSHTLISKHSFLNNTKWLMLDKLIRIFLSFIVSIWLANYLGVKNFGLLNFALSFALIFSSLLTLGLDKYLPKEIVLNPDKENEIITSSLHLRLIGSIFMLIITNTISLFIQNENHQSFILLVMIISIGYSFRAFDILKYWFESHMISIYSLIAQSSALILSSLLKILFILLNLDIIYFAIAIAFEYVIQALILIYLYNQFNTLKHFLNLSIKKTIYVLKQTWPLIFASFLADIYSKIDIVMLGQISSNQSVGLYSAAIKICNSWLFIPTTFAIAFYPAILKFLKKNDIKKYNEISMSLMNIIVVFSLLIAIIFTVFSKEIISLLFSSEYIKSSIVLSIYIWGTIFIGMSSITNRLFVARELVKLILNRSIVGFILNIGLNFLLIPEYSEIGATIATVLSLIITLFLLNFFSIESREIFFLQIKAFNLSSIYKSSKTIWNLK